MSEIATELDDSAAVRLLPWYDAHARDLPWRVPPGRSQQVRPDPYRVWLSEIMLQQTTVVAVMPYFRDFTARWPRVEDLAAASLDDVLTAWAGLGYYARARNLHKCARAVTEDLEGQFPDSETELRKLPGIGLYTAAAIAAIAFDRPATVVDGNVERVVARLFALEAPLPGVKPALKRCAESLTPVTRPGDYAQAVMDLGATICVPRSPKCMLCPLSDICRARALGIAESLPRKAPKAERPTRRAVAFWTQRPDGTLLLRRRAERGLLGGMMEVPSTPWVDRPWPVGEARGHAPLAADWRELPGLVRHTFTHFHFEIAVWSGQVEAGQAAPDGAKWVALDALHDQALPSVMRKIVSHAIGQTG